MNKEGEEGLPWCFQGYPFKYTFEEAIQFTNIGDPTLLSALDEICKNCPKRLEYESHRRSFTV